jgi:hypothetical protein
VENDANVFRDVVAVFAFFERVLTQTLGACDERVSSEVELDEIILSLKVVHESPPILTAAIMRWARLTSMGCLRCSSILSFARSQRQWRHPFGRPPISALRYDRTRAQTLRRAHRFMRVYLDTNAANYLYSYPARPPARLRKFRRALAAACESGDIELIVSDSLLDELSGLAAIDRRRYERTLMFVLDLAGPHVLLPHNERMREEVRHGGRLAGADRFMSKRMRRAVRAHTMQHDFADAVADDVRKRVERYEDEYKPRREDVRRKIGDNWRRDTAAWWKGALPEIDEWTTNHLDGSRQIFGIGTGDTLPEPRSVPTAWHMQAYSMARIALSVGENRKINGSDLYDVQHYGHATYADLMVTDDSGFIATYEAIPDTPFAIQRFAAFAARLGVALE